LISVDGDAVVFKKRADDIIAMSIGCYSMAGEQTARRETTA